METLIEKVSKILERNVKHDRIADTVEALIVKIEKLQEDIEIANSHK